MILAFLQPIPACLSWLTITQILETKKWQHRIVNINFKEFFWDIFGMNMTRNSHFVELGKLDFPKVSVAV